MSHQAVRDFIKDTVLSVRDDIQFTYGRESTFDPTVITTNYACLLLPLKYDPEFVNTTHNRVYRISMIFYAFDSMDGDEVETQDTLDEVDEILTTFQNVLNLNPNSEDTELNLITELIEISNEAVVSRIKQTSKNMTGWQYDFSMMVPDQFDYCSIYD
jgi:predicted DNA-binding protein YlxM (UPF0122 family)